MIIVHNPTLTIPKKNYGNNLSQMLTSIQPKINDEAMCESLIKEK